jgi:hypothetical protein
MKIDGFLAHVSRIAAVMSSHHIDDDGLLVLPKQAH